MSTFLDTHLVLISGLSGSGKSIALRALEDAGYNCIDNLPIALLDESLRLLREAGTTKLALAIDARSGTTLQGLPGFLDRLRSEGASVNLIFLDARDHTLVRRFAETRRRHPLSSGERTIEECLQEERRLLASIADYGHHVDTSDLSPNRLRDWIKNLLALQTDLRTLVLESFGYKAGVPLDADLVFDARCLPNPYYEPGLRACTGKDPVVASFLAAEPRATALIEDITAFLDRWLPEYGRDNRNYFTVAIGCTGGQHRSVYLAEALAARFRTRMNVLVRHRELANS